jgi:hypothetical protein
MKPKDRARAAELHARLQAFSRTRFPLRGVRRKREREAMVAQLIDSIRRVEYIRTIRERDVCSSRCDPATELFDPLKSALLFKEQGKCDDAFWMVFLFTHFSKHAVSGWQLAREVYGGLGRRVWSWDVVSSQTARFCSWLDRNHRSFEGKFGNHRKYEALRPDAKFPTSLVVRSYIDWIGPSKSHKILIARAKEESDGSPGGMFAWLMDNMKQVARFGRLARFDHLAMVGKLGLADIRPESTFLQGATGPLRGARLLFDDDSSSLRSAKDLNVRVIELGDFLGVGMQEMEDAMCNWQKSPSSYLAFRG